MTVGEAMREVAGVYSGLGEILAWAALGGVIIGILIAIIRSDRRNR